MSILTRLFRKKKEPTFEEIREAVKKKYREVSENAEGKFTYPTGRAGAEALGYDPEVIEAMPDAALESFCGVGNPFSLGAIGTGEAVLDVGCGAGFDLIVAGLLVGREGSACGIDLTEEMAEKARQNLRDARVPTFDVRISGVEDIPFESDFFDVVISNGVLNLSPLKEQAFAEIHRVLKPGGRLQFADIVLKADLPDRMVGSLEAWSD
jgi:arsenite methyltransferase